MGLTKAQKARWKRHNKSKKSTKTLAKKIDQIVNRKLETKYVQSSPAIGTIQAYASATTSGSFFFDLTAQVSQGLLDFANRVGDRIQVTSLTINYTIFKIPTVTCNPSDCVRIMVVQYKRADSTPASTEMLRTNSIFGGASVVSSYSFFQS